VRDDSGDNEDRMQIKLLEA